MAHISNSPPVRPGLTQLSTGVIIYLEGLSVRHPKGARSIGIGHPRSGDRCTKTLPYPSTPCGSPSRAFSDPARVSHIPVSQSVRHPNGVAGSLAMPDPRVVGATPLDPGLKSGHPCRGAPFTTLHNELNGFCTTQMRHSCPPQLNMEIERYSAEDGQTTHSTGHFKPGT